MIADLLAIPPDDIEIVYELMPKQDDFVNDDEARELLYSGAFGAGKTRALCVRAVALARYPGARVGLCRKTAVDLKATTLVTLLEPDGELPPVLPPKSYHHHKTENWLRIQGGGVIVYFGVDEPARIGSRLITSICVDEGIELDSEEYTMLLGRLRGKFKMPNGEFNNQSIAIATNPGSPTHFLYERFYQEDHPHRRVIEANTAENHHLPEAYRQSMSELTGTARDRFYLGKWVSYEGAIYSMFDSKIHVLHVDPWPGVYYVAGVDWGFTNPAVIRMHACDPVTGRSHVVHEYYKANVISTDFAQECANVQAQHGRTVFVVDPSAPDIISQLRANGLWVVHPPERDVLAGIRMVQSALAPSSGPLLTMSPECGRGNREYGAYRWKDKSNREQPVKELDHALDADRYARVYIESRTGSQPTPKVKRRTSRRESLRK